MIKDERSSCDRIRLEFDGEAVTRQEPGQLTATIVQQAAEPASATTPATVVGVIETPVALGQSWAVNLGLGGVPGQLVVGYRVYLNGSAHCYSKSSLQNESP